MNGFARVEVDLRVDELQAKPPVRVFGEKIAQPHAVILRRLKIAAFIGDAVEGKVSPAGLFQPQLVVLRERRAPETGDDELSARRGSAAQAGHQQEQDAAACNSAADSAKIG